MVAEEMRGPAPRIFLTGASSGLGAAVAKLQRLLPNPPFDLLFSHAGRKPRKTG